MSFSEVPITWRVPGVYVSVDPSEAERGPGVYPFRALVVGIENSLAGITAETLKATTRVSQAREHHGPGSLTHLMVERWIARNPVTQLDAISMAEPTGTKASRAYTVTAYSSPGSLAAYCCGKRIEFFCQTDTDTCAGNLADAINAEEDLPLTAAAVGSVVTLTAKANGTHGSELVTLAFAYLRGEEYPEGFTISEGSLTAGTGDPSMTNVLAAVAGIHYDVIVHPCIDATNLNAIQSELEDRADVLVGKPSFAISGLYDTVANLQTLGDSRNGRFECLVGFDGACAVGGWGYARAAAVAGMAARFLQDDPVRPVTGRDFLEGYAPKEEERFTDAERNLLLHDGISTMRYASDRATVERLITTYQETAGGTPDETYLDVQTMFGTAYCRRDYQARFAERFPNHKIADDGAPMPPGSHIVTPRTALDDAIAWYSGLVAIGLCEDLAGFRRDAWARRSATDPNRLEIGLPVNLVNQLRVADARIELRR